MDPITISLVLSLAKMVAEMAINWSNPEYVPPSPEELESLAAQVAALPDLPTKEG
jgi:hypothetical protein